MLTYWQVLFKVIYMDYHECFAHIILSYLVAINCVHILHIRKLRYREFESLGQGLHSYKS